MRNGLVGELVRTVSRFAIIGVIGGLASACSSDSMRFSDTPFANPFAASPAQADPGLTGSVDGPAPTRVPRSKISSAPLAPPPGRTASAAPSYNRPPSATPSQPRVASRGGSPGWNVEGGTAITVGPNDTLSTISNRYGVPSSAIASANGLNGGRVSPGSRIVIPVYSDTGGASTRVAASEARPVAPSRAAAPLPKASVSTPAKPQARIAAARTPEVAEPRTTGAIDPKSRPRPAQPAPAATAKAAKVDTKPEKPAPVGKVVKSEPLPPKQPRGAKPKATKVVAKAEPPAPVKVATTKPAGKVPAAKVPAAEAAKPAPEAPKVAAAPSREPEATGAIAASAGEFRWPARGRVISGFGGSGANEGINIAVPDGTPVKAAESGTVAYAGSEVKGYGNLVLIRHDNGYVSAYAHNGEIDVKRGQKVGRGQTIAKSGQSGNVTSPQLHFEIRKGSTPVDPMKHLASN